MLFIAISVGPIIQQTRNETKSGSSGGWVGNLLMEKWRRDRLVVDTVKCSSGMKREIGRRYRA
jgi:hypothetical protein